MKKIILAAAVMMVVIAMAGGAFALTITPQVNVTGTVTGKCTIVTSPGNMAFTIDPSLGGPFNAVVGTKPVIKCTKSYSYTIVCTSTNTFKLKQGTDLIPYSFTCPSGGSGGGFGAAGGITLTIGGQVSTGYADAPAGAGYTDIVTITVSY